MEIDIKIPVDSPGHVTDHLLDQLKQFPPEHAATQQILRSIADRGIGFTPTGGNAILIHPGSGSNSKRWPFHNFIQLAKDLISQGQPVRFVIGEVERERLTAEELKQLQSLAPLKSCQNFLELLVEVSSACAFLGSDTGPSHLAGIIGLPTLALFGPTRPENWRPLGPHVRTLSHHPLSELSCSEVLKYLTHLPRPQSAPKESNELDTDD